MDKQVNYQAMAVYATACEQNFKAVLSETGYKPQYTFYADLSRAEYMGEDVINETVKLVVKNWIGNIKAITEFAMSVNHKAWEMYARQNQRLTQLYSSLYHRVCVRVEQHYAEDTEKLDYFYSTLD